MVWRRTFRRFSRKGGRSQFLSTDLLAKTSCSPQKEAFTHRQNILWPPHACLLPASLPWLPASALQAKLHIHRSKLGKAIRSLLICQIGWRVSGMFLESISVDGLVSKNKLLTTIRSFHTSPEYTVTPQCLLTACQLGRAAWFCPTGEVTHT